MLCRGTIEEKLNLCFDLYDSKKKGYLDVEDMILMAGKQNALCFTNPDTIRLIEQNIPVQNQAI